MKIRTSKEGIEFWSSKTANGYYVWILYWNPIKQLKNSRVKFLWQIIMEKLLKI